MFNYLIHNKYQTLTNCPICNKKYDKHWKVVNHIRKTKDLKHSTFLNEQEQQYITIYENNSKTDLFPELYKQKNIFAGTSFTHNVDILKKKYTEEEVEQMRTNKISKTMKKVIKTTEHNKHVSDGVKKAWINGIYNTEEIKKAKEKGYLNRRSFKGENNPMFGKPSPRGSGRGKGGIREDLGHYVRSTWEANICRICKLMNRKYLYESKRFEVKINNSRYTYCPDLYFPEKDFYYEIKGHAKSSKQWLCECATCIKNKKVLAAIKKQVRIIVLGKEEYVRFRKMFKGRIELWEGR